MEVKDPIQDKLGALGASDPEEFRLFLRRLRKLFPKEAAEAYVLYIASHGLDAAARSMAFWLSGDTTYVNVLLDPDGLSPESAAMAIPVVRQIDEQFLAKFVKATMEIKSPPLVLRALGLLPALGDYSAFIPWLRRLSQSSDTLVRSRSSKLLCELRPNKGVVEQQMQSSDARVRSTAIQAMWSAGSEDARKLFRRALADPSHRVVSNAMVGLYLLGETQVLSDMIEYRGHKDHLFRAAMAWAIGHVKNPLAIPALRELSRDPSLIVRKRALSSLRVLESLAALEAEIPGASLEPVGSEPDVETKQTPAEQIPALPIEPAAAETAVTFNFSMFG